MQKSKCICLLLPLLFPLLIPACSTYIQYDSATFKEYENFDPHGLTLVVTTDVQNYKIERNYEYNGAERSEELFRSAIKKHLSTFLSKYSKFDIVHWGELKSGQNLAPWEFEIQEMKLNFNLPTDTNKIEFKDHDADIVLIIGRIEINYITYVTKGHKPNIRDYYHSDYSDYWKDISYLYWDNQKGHVISFGKRVISCSRRPGLGGKKMLSHIAIKLLDATPFQGEWETGSLLYYKNL